MAIESANVSKPVIREVEKGSGGNSWSPLQGSSTEGKDSPFNSIWEKTVEGAQKLFGMGTTKQNSQGDTLKEEEEKKDSSTSSEVVTPQESFSSVPGFGGNNFSYFSAGRRRVDTNVFAAVSTSRIAPDAVKSQGELTVAHDENYDVQTSKGHRDDAISVKQKARYEQKEKMTIEEGNDSESPEKKASESKAPIPVSSRRTVTAAPIVQSASASPVVEASPENAPLAQGAAVPAQPAVATAQAHAATAPVLEANKKIAAPVPAQFTTSKQTQTQPQASLQPLSQPAQAQAVSAQPQAQFAVAKSVPVAAAQSVNAQAAEPVTLVAAEKANPTGAPVLLDGKKAAETSVRVSDEALAMAPEKANQALVEAVRKSATARNDNATTKPAAQSSQANMTAQSLATTQSDSSQKTVQAETSGLKMPEQVGEVKGSPTHEVLAKDSPIVAGKAGQGVTGARGMPSAEQSAMARQQALADPASEVSTVNSSQRSQSASTASATVSQVSSGSVRPTGIQSQNRPLGQGGTAVTNVAGVSAGTTAAVNPGSAGAQSQNGETGEGLKQDLSAQLKNASAGKTADKGSGDAGQAFDVKGLTSDAARKGEAATKARPTSYVSKTVEEMKEVVATLTKSIDRLITAKPGTMNLKINFDQGGSMNIRITLDGSQVSTSMQTDVPGLEGMIKSNWSDLAGDWNQKGVKLNAPQFQQSADSSSDPKGDSWNEFAEKQQNRRSGFNGSTAKNSGTGQGASGNASDNTGAAQQEESATEEVISETELKTYA